MPNVRVVPSTAVANRFSSLATESDDEQDLEEASPSRPPCVASDHDECVRCCRETPHLFCSANNVWASGAGVRGHHCGQS